MWIVSLADDSHELSTLIFPAKQQKMIENRPLQFLNTEI